MHAEQSQNFNERLGQWVTQQGFWFQLRYSMAGSGAGGNALFHLFRLAFRLLIFLLIAAIGGGIYLVKRGEGPAFQNSIKQALTRGLTASKVEIKGCVRDGGFLNVRRLVAEGDRKTFFSSLEARSVRGKMGLLDGLTGTWDLGNVTISRLNVDLRAGADDEASAKWIGDAFFKTTAKVAASTFDVADTTLHWGYSESTLGAIENSEMKAQRQESGVKLTFTGGTFTQNWLQRLEIVKLVVNCTRDGLVFEKAAFKRGTGTVDFSGLKVTSGEDPLLNGTIKIRNLQLENALPAALKTYLEGSISADLSVFGSTNTAEGIGFKGPVVLKDQDLVSLLEGTHLLKALSVVDYSRNYRRVDFREGRFDLKIQAGGLELTAAKLKANELLTLEGRMKVRLPTALEKREDAKKNPLNHEGFLNPESPQPDPADSAETPKKSATEKTTGAAAPEILGDRLALSDDMQRLNLRATETTTLALRYEGNFHITLLPDAFERAPKLRDQFPVDPASNRIPMVVPLEGTLYDLTLKQSEEIYQQGRR
jgi:hypothetical protein